MKKLLITLLAIFIFNSVGSYAIELKKHHKMFIGWIPFNASKYKAYGYKSRDEFKVVTDYANREIFQKELSNLLYNFFCTDSAKHNKDILNTYTWYSLKISNVELSYNLRELSAIVSIIDIDENVLEYRFPIRVRIPDGIEPLEKDDNILYLSSLAAVAIYYEIILK